MTQYINKTVVVTEIEKKLQDLIVCKKDAFYAEERVALRAKINMCKEILSLFDTLEVKEVNLEKIISEMIEKVIIYIIHNTRTVHYNDYDTREFNKSSLDDIINDLKQAMKDE